MFQLLNPLWLYSIAALAVPLVIHLLNVRHGKKMMVGSVVLLTEASSKTSRKPKLADLLLLALRCLLVILLAFLLSKPVWRTIPFEGEVKGWLLIPKEQTTEAIARFRPEIDSAMKGGYQFHYFDYGFPLAELNNVAHGNAKQERKDGKQLPSYWNLLRALDQKLPQGTRAFVISDNRLNRFSGSRPEVSFQLTWKTFTPSDSVTSRMSNAYFTPTGILKVAVATSTPSAVSYKIHSIPSSQKNPNFQINVLGGKPFVTSIGDDSVAIDTATIAVAIYSEKYKNDAENIKAAVGAIQQFTERKINVSFLRNGEIPSNTNFIFWLSDKPMGKLPSGVQAFQYEPGKVKELRTWIENRSGTIGNTELFKRTDITGSFGATIWEDGFGTPLLTKAGQIYHFYSHFDPEWNELPWSGELPKLLMPLLLQSEVTRSRDNRSISSQQLLPKRLDSKNITVASDQSSRNLEPQFWLALFLSFAVERWLSYRKQSLSNG